MDQENQVQLDKLLKNAENLMIDKLKRDLEVIFLKEIDIDELDQESASHTVRYERFLAAVRCESKRLQSFEAIVERGRKMNDQFQNLSF